MRALILTATAVLLISGCRNSDQGNTAQNIDDSLTADSIVANDVTAIDAVTGDAANMAADVDINFTNDMLGGSGPSDAPKAKAKPAPKSPASAGEPKPSPAPAADQPAANATSNSTE
jgi:hypothetical protein